jgi:hypothetical protein
VRLVVVVSHTRRLFRSELTYFKRDCATCGQPENAR